MLKATHIMMRSSVLCRRFQTNILVIAKSIFLRPYLRFLRGFEGVILALIRINFKLFDQKTLLIFAPKRMLF